MPIQVGQVHPLLHDRYRSGRRAPMRRPDTRPDLVGVAGFEPTAPRSQSECATKLRHTPSRVSLGHCGAAAVAVSCRPGAR